MIIDGSAVNVAPIIDPVAAVVCAADISNVKTVIVDGEIRKHDFRLKASLAAPRHDRRGLARLPRLAVRRARAGLDHDADRELTARRRRRRLAIAACGPPRTTGKEIDSRLAPCCEAASSSPATPAPGSSGPATSWSRTIGSPPSARPSRRRAEVIELGGRIVMPGFVDTHRHTWQSIVRNIASDWTLTDYLVGLHAGLIEALPPEDTYIGNLLGALEALDSGITTLVDWSHNLFTPEHADAADPGAPRIRDARRLRPRRRRAAVGRAAAIADVPHPEDARRIRAQHFASNDGLVTMALALRGPQFCTRGDQPPRLRARPRPRPAGDGPRRRWRVGQEPARSRSSSAMACSPTGRPTSTATRSATTSSTSSATPAAPPRWPRTSRCRWATAGRRRGACWRTASGRRSRSTSAAPTAATCSGRCARRSAPSGRLDNADAVERGDSVEKVSLSCREVIEFATIDGAHAAGLDAVTGSLTPGKQADLIVLRGDSLALNPVNNPYGAVVYDAHPGVVEDVMVAGVWRKRHGTARRRRHPPDHRLANESRDHVFAAFGEGRIGGDWIPKS